MRSVSLLVYKAVDGAIEVGAVHRSACSFLQKVLFTPLGLGS